MTKFSAFRLSDLLTFGAFGALLTVLAGIVYANGVTGEPLALMIFIAVIAWAIYGLVVYGRYKLTRRITYITKQKVAVITNGFSAKKEDVESIIDKVIADWNAAIGWSGSAKALEGFFVEFRAYPVKMHSRPNAGLFAGFTTGNGSVVGYKDDLSTTALFHELGHKVHWQWTGEANNDECHKFMAEHNLV
jgi:hypothetical protein